VSAGRGATALLCLALGAGPALAADPPAAPAAPRSDAERLAAADAVVNRIRAAARQVAALLEDAKQERDVLRATCLSDRLAQARTVIAAAERASSALHEAIAARQEGAEVELSALEVAGLHAAQARAEADRCVGALPHAVDGTRVEQVPPPGKAGKDR
jgi:hypothetical protein